MKKYDVFILLAGCFWGVIGVFTRNLGAAGIDSSGVLIIRSGGCAVLFAVWTCAVNPALFRVRIRDLWLAAGFGLVTFFFTYCYYQSIACGSLSAACTLMYSAPVFVMVMSLFLFGERFSRRKLLALLCAVAGCTLVSGVLEGDSDLSVAGVVYGLLAGIGYATYSVLIKALSNRGYESLTINTWGWTVCTVAGLLVWGFSPAAGMLESVSNALWSLGLVVVSGFLPALFYSLGLRGMEAGKGAVMASVEPVVASLTGLIVFREVPSVLGGIGIVLVIGGVALLNLTPKPKQVPDGTEP